MKQRTSFLKTKLFRFVEQFSFQAEYNYADLSPLPIVSDLLSSILLDDGQNIVHDGFDTVGQNA